MKIQQHLRYVAVLLAAGALALPVAAQAGDAASKPVTVKHHVKHHCKYKKHHCWHKHCCCKWRCHMVCQIKPAHWWGTHWFSESKECWWVK